MRRRDVIVIGRYFFLKANNVKYKYEMISQGDMWQFKAIIVWGSSFLKRHTEARL